MDDITIRPVEPEDAPSLFPVLAQLTKAPALPEAKFRELVEEERRRGLRHTLVAVDASNKVIATGAVFLENKFIRGGATCAHIEDIVVDSSVRGQQVGKRIIEALVQVAKEKGCYKVILDCSEENRPFYEKCGFERKEVQMALYF